MSAAKICHPFSSDPRTHRCQLARPEYALKFAVNPIVASHIAGGDKSQATLGQLFVAGSVSGVVLTTSTYPLEMLKARITVAEKGEYSSVLDCVRRTATEGRPGELMLRRFYRGYGASLLGSVPYNGAQLGLNSHLRQQCKQQSGGSTASGAASVGISLSSSFAGISLSYPFNLVRTKLQTQGVRGRSVLYAGVSDCIAKTVQHEGVRGLFRGFAPNAIKALPAQIIALEIVSRMSAALLEEEDERQ